LRRLFLFLVIFFGAAPLAPGQFMTPANAESVEIAQSGIVQEIIVRGAQRIEPGTVKSYLLIREGDAFDTLQIDRSLKSLFATGLFADVSIQRQGAGLIVNVVENPVINRIAFEGNGELDNETLETEVSLRPRVIYTRSKVQGDIKRILTLYRRNGLFAVTVEPKVIQLAQNRIDLVFEINEGEPTAIRSIRFVGNERFSDRRLRSVVQTKESAWWRFFSSDDVYDPDRLTLDRELLRRFYLSDGYADFRVTSAIAELTPNREDFFVTFSVNEGERYAFGKIDVDARLRDLKPTDIQKVIEIEPNDWYDISEVDDAINAITQKVGELGYAFVDVRPRIKRDKDKRKINIVFEVKEGPRVFVERIDIAGNVRTLDKVIRREFQLVEGDAFNTAKLRRSRQRIQRLNFFEKVQVGKVPGSAPDKAVIKVDVEEKSTGSISLGAGFSSSVGVIGEIGLEEKNFLGRGQSVAVKFSLAAERSQIDFSFTEPYFMDREVSAGFDVFHVRQNLQDFSSIDSNRTGLRLRAGYKITDNVSQRWSYMFRMSEIDEVDTNAAQLIKDQQGKEYTSEIGHTISYDTLDDPISPTEGYVLSLASGLTGLGGTVRHFKNVLRGGMHFPIVDEWVLSLGGKTGYVLGLGKDVKFLDRFFIGGDNLRGFETSGVGPRDRVSQDSLGGEWMYTGLIQLSFPVGLPAELGVKGRVFSDFGSSGQIEPTNSDVQDTGSVRVTAGFGISWASPFGPLGVDAGVPLVQEDFDREELIRINFGTRF